jgi:hypothetical protein
MDVIVLKQSEPLLGLGRWEEGIKLKSPVFGVAHIAVLYQHVGHGESAQDRRRARLPSKAIGYGDKVGLVRFRE